MVEVFLPSGASYHKPPYTDEEVRDLNRRVSGIVAFTRPGGQRAAAPGDAGSGPEQGPVQRQGPCSFFVLLHRLKRYQVGSELQVSARRTCVALSCSPDCGV